MPTAPPFKLGNLPRRGGAVSSNRDDPDIFSNSPKRVRSAPTDREYNERFRSNTSMRINQVKDQRNLNILNVKKLKQQISLNSEIGRAHV